MPIEENIERWKLTRSISLNARVEVSKETVLLIHSQEI